MNERIENCLYQAGLTAQGCWDELDDYARQGIEKFAELIVRECAKLVDQDWHVSGAELREHFGVEERKDLVCPKCGVDRTLVDELQIECDRLYRIIELNGILK